MDKDNRIEGQAATDQDAVMDRVNQTFDKITQDVRDMIQQNNQQEDTLS
ncbi:hypothetical protein [Neobacillus dielmonensis]|nr:hypothetical protein [Neobacillus dielmonensis]